MTGAAGERLANLRDVAAAGAGLRPGVLWRSAQPLPGDAVPDEVVGWPPRTVLDLRSAAEVPEGEHPLAAAVPEPGAGAGAGAGGAVLHRVELLDHVGDPQALAARRRTLAEVYASVLEPGTSLVRAVSLVATSPAPVLVHCAAGKDRTGVVVALALRLVGVGVEAVLADYALTTAQMPAVVQRLLASSPLPAGADLSTLPPEYFEAPAEALAGVLEVWDAHPGGVRAWFVDHGGRAEALAALDAALRGDPAAR